MLTYAGIGSRETPAPILREMTIAAKQLCDMGWSLRSGGAHGADTAFSEGTMQREIHIPWAGYNSLHPDGRHIIVPYFNSPLGANMRALAAKYHPAWDRLTEGARKLMMRNVTICLGLNLRQPVDMIICWTPKGQVIGGTGQALRLAEDWTIPVFNLALQDDIAKCIRFVDTKKNSHG